MYDFVGVRRHLMRQVSAAFGLVLVLSGETAFAQSSTNCIGMGPGMLHCDTMKMDSAVTGDGGAALGAGIGALIARKREFSIRKKVGKMISDGDCHGALAFALEKGRLELANMINETCGK